MNNPLFTETEYLYAYSYIKNKLTEGIYFGNQDTIPLATLLGGQPGAGKSNLTNVILSDNENTIVIDGDQIRNYHPHIKEIEAEYGMDYPKATQPFVNRAVEQLIDELSKERYNLIIEGTLRDINVPIKTASLLKERDYQIELYVIATDKEISWKATIARGDALKEAGETPRYVDKIHHDKVVESIPQTLTKLASRDDLFDDIVIMNRNQQILYQKTTTPEKDPGEVLRNALNGRTELEELQSLDDMIKEAFVDRIPEKQSNERDFHSSQYENR